DNKVVPVDITALSHALSNGFDEVLEGWRGDAGKKADPRHGRLLGISDEGTEAQHQHENEHRRDKERCRQFVLHHLPPVIAFAMTAHTQRRCRSSYPRNLARAHFLLVEPTDSVEPVIH